MRALSASWAMGLTISSPAPMRSSTRLHISKADYTIRMVKQQGYTFFDTLKNKLMWGVDKRNG